MFLGLPPAPAATIYTGILWVIPGGMVAPFLSLYLVKSLGLSEMEFGLYQSWGKLIGPVALFAGGYFSDVWGRKKSLAFFDALTWGGYCLCLALATNKWWGVAAILFLAANMASGPAYQCLLIEGIKPKNRSLAYTVNQIANQTPSLLFFPLLGGLWVSYKGLSAANHQMYWFYFFMVVVGIGLRLKFIPHSGAYEKIPQTWLHAFKDGIRQYWETFQKFFEKKTSVVFLISKCMDEWMVFMWATYAYLYFVNHMGLKEVALSVFYQVTAYAAFFILFFIMPHITGKWMLKVLGWEQLAGMAALAVLLLGDRFGGNIFWICFLASSLMAVSTIFYSSNTAAIWMNIMTEKERAKVVAVSTALISLWVALSGSAGSFLYGQISPVALLWALLGARMINWGLLRWVARSLKPAV